MPSGTSAFSTCADTQTRAVLHCKHEQRHTNARARAHPRRHTPTPRHATRTHLEHFIKTCLLVQLIFQCTALFLQVPDLRLQQRLSFGLGAKSTQMSLGLLLQNLRLLLRRCVCALLCWGLYRSEERGQTLSIARVQNESSVACT